MQIVNDEKKQRGKGQDGCGSQHHDQKLSSEHTMRSGYDDNHAVLISASTLGGVDASSNVLHDKDNLDKPESETFASASIVHIDHHHSNLNSAQQ